MGGGQGRRLSPLTNYRSKPAVPIGGKYRLVDIPISNCINAGLKRIFVLTQFNSTSLHRHIHRTYPYEPFNQTSVELLAAEQTLSNSDWFQGTADAVRKHLPHYHIDETETFLILSGDHLYRMDYNEILRFHEEKNADVTIATIPVLKREVGQFGIMQMNSNAVSMLFWRNRQAGRIFRILSCPRRCVRLSESRKRRRFTWRPWEFMCLNRKCWCLCWQAKKRILARKSFRNRSTSIMSTAMCTTAIGATSEPS